MHLPPFPAKQIQPLYKVEAENNQDSHFLPRAYIVRKENVALLGKSLYNIYYFSLDLIVNIMYIVKILNGKIVGILYRRFDNDVQHRWHTIREQTR